MLLKPGGPGRKRVMKWGALIAKQAQGSKLKFKHVAPGGAAL